MYPFESLLPLPFGRTIAIVKINVKKYFNHFNLCKDIQCCKVEPISENRLIPGDVNYRISR